MALTETQRALLRGLLDREIKRLEKAAEKATNERNQRWMKYDQEVARAALQSAELAPVSKSE